MSRYFLTKLRVEGFRGINNESEPVELKFAKDAANSVFAVNGTGKSSLFDALCYAICGSIPKLDKLQASEKPEDYYANRFHSQGEATIEIELESDDSTAIKVVIEIVRKADSTRQVTSPSGHSDPESVLASLNQSFTLLDYQSFTKFIDHTPLDRGRSFSSLLGLSVYSDFRQTLKTAIDTRALNADLDLPALQTAVSSHREAANLAMGRMEVSFSALTGSSLKDTSKINDYSTQVVTALAGIALIKTACEGKTLAELDFDLIKSAIKTAEGGKDREKLASLTGSIAKLEALGSADEKSVKQEQAALQTKLNEATDLYAKTKGDLSKSLYSTAAHLLAKGDWPDEHTCPLCESALERPITDIVSEQQRQYAQVDAKILEIQTTWQDGAWRTRLSQLENAIGVDLPEEERLFASFDQQARQGIFSLNSLTSLITYYEKLETRLATALSTYKEHKQEVEQKLPPSLVQLTEQVEHAKQYREALDDYIASSKKLGTANKKLQLRKRWQSFIIRAAEVFAKAETKLSKDKITALESEYKAMFVSIMGVNDIKPDLKRDGDREELHVQLSEFHGLHDVSARALLSESYRNALAISVYLTAAINHKGTPRFIVLDDITSSFDSGHQLNLMEYIRTKLRYPNNPDGLQFIILSHDGIMQKYFDGLQPSEGWRHQVLEGNPPGAITTRGQSASGIRTIAATHLNAGQVSIAQPWVRQYLECILMQVIRSVKITVPIDFAIKDHTRMVSNCINAIQSAVALQDKAGGLILDTTQVAGLTGTYVPALIGNWIAHYETGSGASVTPAMLLSVLQAVDDFADCFKYDFANPAGIIERRWYKNLASR